MAPLTPQRPVTARSPLMLLAIVVFVVLCGALLAFQAAINASLARHLASPVAAVAVSLIVSFLCVLPFLVTSVADIRTASLGAAPWWIWIGGITGAVFVAAGLMLTPIIGVAFFFTAVVFGQLLAGVLIDHYGLFGMPVKPIDVSRLLGLGLVLAGLVVYRSARF